MAVVQAVTIDLAGTLLFPHPSVGSVYAACARRHGVEVSAAELDAAFPLGFKGAPRQAKPEAFWREVVMRSFGPALPASKFEAVFRDCWEAFGRGAAWRVAPAAVTALTAIRFLGVKVAALSNADARMRTVLADKRLTHLFDGVFLSDETGAAKPDPKAYAHAARQLGVALSAMVHVGDDPKEDGEGARDAGAIGVIVGGAYAPEKCLRAEHLRDLPFVLRALLTEGKAMHDNQGLAWHQVALAANAPMLTKATMVDGDVEVGILPTGQVVGEMSLFTGEPRSATVVAIRDSLLARLDKPDFEQLVTREPRVSIAVTRRRINNGKSESTETWPTTYKPTPNVICGPKP